VLWIPGGLLVVAAALVWRRGLPGDLLVRAVLWSNLVLGFLLAASLATTAVIQLALPMPLVVALAGRDSLRPASDSRLAAALMTGVIVALMAIAAVGMVMGHAPIKL
jgi:hypothetical protein